jgi:hypothetical protein
MRKTLTFLEGPREMNVFLVMVRIGCIVKSGMTNWTVFLMMLDLSQIAYAPKG